MTEKRKSPALRFRGYTDDWEQRKLGELSSSFEYGLNAAAKEYDGENKYIRITDIDDDSREFKQEDITSPDTDLSSAENYKLSEGDFLLARTGASVGKSYIYKASDGLVYYAGFLIRARIKPEYNSEFVFQNTLTGDYEKFIKVTSMRSGQPGVNAQEYSQYQIMMPSKPEQDKISDCLRNLDNLITLHQRKLEKLKLVKKSMLEKMFPKNGSSVPEIRFNGFTDDWEQRKVGDLLIERNQQAPMSDEYPLMAFIANEGVSPKGERYDRSALVTDTVNKLYKKTEKGDFIYSSNNLETGSIGLNKYGKACISPVYSIFKPTGIADSDFLGRRLVRKDFINAMVKWRQGVIYGQWRIHESDFLKIEIPVPAVEEQRKIGAYLDQLDNLITLHQRKLERRLFFGCRFFIQGHTLTWCPSTKEQGIAGSEAPRQPAEIRFCSKDVVPVDERTRHCGERSTTFNRPNPILLRRRGARRRKNKVLRGAKHHAQPAEIRFCSKDVVPGDERTRHCGE